MLKAGLRRMTNKDKKIEIIKMITTIVKDRYKKHIAAQADLEAEQTKQRCWENTEQSKWNDYSGGFGPQPPNVDLYRSKSTVATSEFEKWESIYEYALENLIGD